MNHTPNPVLPGLPFSAPCSPPHDGARQWVPLPSTISCSPWGGHRELRTRVSPCIHTLGKGVSKQVHYPWSFPKGVRSGVVPQNQGTMTTVSVPQPTQTTCYQSSRCLRPAGLILYTGRVSTGFLFNWRGSSVLGPARGRLFS